MGRSVYRRMMKRLGVAGFVVFLFVLALELAARLAFPPPLYFHGLPYDPDLGFRPPANFYQGNSDEGGSFPFRLNRWGFRGPELPAAAKPPGTQRLLFLGDSFLQGWQVREEDLVPQSSAAELRRQGEEVEAYGLACDGYGTVQQALLLRKYAADIDPDAVVVCMYVANDISDNSRAMVGRTMVSQGAYLRPYFEP